jgi:uncharacterized membrane protein YGL010W
MKTLNDYFIEYEDSHQNPINKRIHYFCVPLIFFSSLGIMKALPVPSSWPLWFDLSVVFMILSNLYLFYFKNWRVVLSFAIVLILMTFILEFLRPRFFILSLLVFIICWIGQFIGHHIEGKRPSFLKDLFFLLIGPIWVINKITKQIGIDLKINNAKEI